jgi:hypothetical protein
VPPVKFNATIYILTTTSGEYDDTRTDVVGVTTDRKKAEAWVQLGLFDPNITYEMEVATLNLMDDRYLKQIVKWLDPKENPLCECGHRLLHHRGGKLRSCKYNSKHEQNKHECKRFRLAENQNG